MSPNKNRASLGDEEVTLSDEVVQKLTAIEEEGQRMDLALERHAQEITLPYYAKRREVLKSIPQFWTQALNHTASVSLHIQHQQDQDALTYLEDVWVARDKTEPRCFALEFHFKSNPYFSNKVLTKEYKYLARPAETEETPDVGGITKAMLEFDWERDTAPQMIQIDWKDDSKNLTKIHPRVSGEDNDDIPSDPGSFFNFFTHADDPFDIGLVVANDLFPQAIDFFKEDSAEGEYDDDSEDDDDDNEEDEIDLEKPRKRQKI